MLHPGGGLARLAAAADAAARTVPGRVRAGDARQPVRLGVRDEVAGRPAWLVGGVAALVALAVVFSLPGLDRHNPLLGPTRRGQRVEEDLEAVHRQLAALGPGNVYSHFEWGEYLSWSI